MNNQAFADAIDQLINSLKNSKDEKVSKKQLGFWVPEKHQEKYERIQRATNKKFGKAIQELIKQAIEKVDEAEIV